MTQQETRQEQIARLEVQLDKAERAYSKAEREGNEDMMYDIRCELRDINAAIERWEEEGMEEEPGRGKYVCTEGGLILNTETCLIFTAQDCEKALHTTGLDPQLALWLEKHGAELRWFEEGDDVTYWVDRDYRAMGLVPDGL